MNRVKVLAIVTFLCAVCGTIGLAGTINYNNGNVYVQGGSGNYTPITDLLLFYDAGANQVAGGGDDVLLNPPGPTGGTWQDIGWYLGSFDTVSTDLYFFATVYDAPSVAAAQWYVDLGVGHALFPTGSEPPYNYSFGSNPAGTDWQPIPEPSTMALAGLGLVIAAARKRFGKK
jgi:hypothetical protein